VGRAGANLIVATLKLIARRQSNRRILFRQPSLSVCLKRRLRIESFSRFVVMPKPAIPRHAAGGNRSLLTRRRREGEKRAREPGRSTDGERGKSTPCKLQWSDQNRTEGGPYILGGLPNFRARDRLLRWADGTRTQAIGCQIYPGREYRSGRAERARGSFAVP
jgi:hypothetical protein